MKSPSAKFKVFWLKNDVINHGGHKPGKCGQLREFEKLSKSQGKLREILIFVEKTWKSPGK